MHNRAFISRPHRFRISNYISREGNSEQCPINKSCHTPKDYLCYPVLRCLESKFLDFTFKGTLSREEMSTPPIHHHKRVITTEELPSKTVREVVIHQDKGSIMEAGREEDVTRKSYSLKQEEKERRLVIRNCTATKRTSHGTANQSHKPGYLATFNSNLAKELKFHRLSEDVGFRKRAPSEHTQHPYSAAE